MIEKHADIAQIIYSALSTFEYDESVYSYAFLCLKKATKITLRDTPTVENFRAVFEKLAQAFGDPVCVHTRYGFIFENLGKYIAFNTFNEAYKYSPLTIFVFDKLPSGKIVTYSEFLEMKDAIQTTANKYGLHKDVADVVLTYKKNIYSCCMLFENNTQVMLFIHKTEITYLMMLLVYENEKITRIIPKGYGKITVDRTNLSALSKVLCDIFDKTR